MTNQQIAAAIDRLESLKIQVDGKIDKREDYYLDRSEQWKKSDKAWDYSDRTDLLGEASTNIEKAVENLREYLGL